MIILGSLITLSIFGLWVKNNPENPKVKDNQPRLNNGRYTYKSKYFVTVLGRKSTDIRTVYNNI